MPPTIGGETSKVDRPPLFSKARMMIVAALLAIFVICCLIAWQTRDAMAFLPSFRRQANANTQSTLVDLRPWQTAEELAALAVTVEEQGYAREAEHLADHEVDQEFALALRQAQARVQRRVLTGESLALSQKVAQLQQLVKDDQARVQVLTQSASQAAAQTTRATPAADAAPANDDLELAKAQLGLDSDELADAQQDLARAVGDERGRIQQELAAHEAAMKKFDSEASTRSLGAVATSQAYHTVARRLRAWLNQRDRYQLLQQAAQEADADYRHLMAQHAAMQNQPLVKPQLARDRISRLNAMKSGSVHSQMLSILDDRIQTQTQLGAVYRKWAAQVLLQHQIVFHLLMDSLAWLTFILICAFVLDAIMCYIFDHPKADRRMYSFRLISKLAIQFVSAAVILLIIFGTPSEMPTIVGLTTAGLTVVLQDFIISFCGWFVLMGKNGIRVGDWVEINGVGGEVVEIGMFRTSLLETGNWTDHGHPTGRRVTFTNSFAIKGQYFNFTTSGQWLWDEITVTVPNSEDVYATIELIHQAVLKETEEESNLAEEEWRRVGRTHGLTQMSTAAAVNLRPSATGIDIVVRYVTRAATRFKVRNVVYRRVIELLHKPVAAG